MNVSCRALGLSLLALATPLAAAEHGAQLVDQAWVKAMKANDLEATMGLMGVSWRPALPCYGGGSR